MKEAGAAEPVRIVGMKGKPCLDSPPCVCVLVSSLQLQSSLAFPFPGNELAGLTVI